MRTRHDHNGKEAEEGQGKAFRNLPTERSRDVSMLSEERTCRAKEVGNLSLSLRTMPKIRGSEASGGGGWDWICLMRLAAV